MKRHQFCAVNVAEVSEVALDSLEALGQSLRALLHRVNGLGKAVFAVAFGQFKFSQADAV